MTTLRIPHSRVHMSKGELKNIVAFHGSPRENGNTRALLDSFLEGVHKNTSMVEVIEPHQLHLESCHGCLRCNLLRRCSITGDQWQELSQKILDSDILVFAAPVYFHHLPGPMKIMLDKFRSFNHVQITETGLIHTPWQEWKKDFVLLLTMGSPDPTNADPVVDLFKFISSILGSSNKLHVITATRLAVAKQILKSAEELKVLYQKLKIPVHLADQDFIRNRESLEKAKNLGSELTG